MFFSIRTKNLNWEILNRNLVAFKKRDEVYYGSSLKNPIFRGCMKNQYTVRE